MSDGSDGWDVRYLAVFYAEAFAEHSLKSALTIARIITIEIVPSHLVDHNAHHELGAFGLCLSYSAEGTENENQSINSVHVL